MTDASDEDIDFEADADQIIRVEARPLGDPSVIVDNLHITYRVVGGKRVGPAPTRMSRILRRGAGNVGSVVEIQAVRGVSFVARHGESIGIVGRNGSGKSTLLRAAAGLIPPTKGAVYISGEPSLLGVNAALLSDLSGERNIMIGGLALGLSPAEVREKFDEIVEFAGIGDFVYLPMKAYSSGMQARLRFAISTAAVPDVLMIDEALATGDAEFRARSAEKVAQIVQNAGTIFLVSHSLASIRGMCTRAIWLEKGVMKMDGPVDEVCDAYHERIKAQPKAAKAGAKREPGAKPEPGAKAEPGAKPKPGAQPEPGVTAGLNATGEEAKADSVAPAEDVEQARQADAPTSR